jgi:hypothetical protein
VLRPEEGAEGDPPLPEDLGSGPEVSGDRGRVDDQAGGGTADGGVPILPEETLEAGFDAGGSHARKIEAAAGSGHRDGPSRPGAAPLDAAVAPASGGAHLSP